MTENPTQLEAGHNHVLAYCRTCASWRRITWDRPEALEAAASHVQLVHDNHELARIMRKRAAATRRRWARSS